MALFFNAGVCGGVGYMIGLYIANQNTSIVMRPNLSIHNREARRIQLFYFDPVVLTLKATGLIA
jgi:hypothetical protein